MTNPRTIRFVVQEHEDHGFRGLIPEGAPATFFPLGPMGVMHDLIEHTHYGPDMGTLHDEMRAFGVAHWLRGQGEWWHQNMPTAHSLTAPENTHAEIVEFFSKWFHDPGSDSFEPCDKEVEIDEVGSDMLAETMRLCRKHVIEEAAESYDDYPPRDDDRPLMARMREHFHDILKWLRVGWAEAEERFDGNDPWTICWTWLQMQKEIDERLKGKHHPWGEAQIDDVLICTWDDSSLEWSVTWGEPPNYPEPEYETNWAEAAKAVEVERDEEGEVFFTLETEASLGYTPGDDLPDDIVALLAKPLTELEPGPWERKGVAREVLDWLREDDHGFQETVDEYYREEV